MKIEIEVEKTFRVGDETFGTREEAAEYAAVLAVEKWLGGPDVTAADLVAKITADPKAAREVLGPLMPVKRQRGADTKPGKRRAKATVEGYETMLEGAA